MRRSGLEASEGCRDRALQERDKSRELAANAALKSRVAKRFFSEMEASVSSGKEPRPAAEAVKEKAEADRLPAELALRAERQHRFVSALELAKTAVLVPPGLSAFTVMLLRCYQLYNSWYPRQRESLFFSYPVVIRV